MSETRGFPFRTVGIGIGLLVVIAIVSAATTFIVGKRIRTITSSQVLVLANAERLERQREILELSTRLAIATGDEAYSTRYAQVQPQLVHTLDALGGAISLPANREVYEGLRRYEPRLAAVEYRALDLAVSDHRGEAQTLLADPGYARSAAEYRRGLQEMRDRSTAYVAAMRTETDNWLRLSFWISMLGLALLVVAWFIVVRPARQWGRELADARRRAEEAARTKSDFLAMMSHEVRTPLNGILGFADLLTDDRTLSASQRHQAELIRSAGAMLLTVVNDLLDFSKIEAGKIELHEEAFAIESLVDNSVSIVRSTAEGKGLELRVATDPCMATFYTGDQDRLRQVLLNLLNNAVKFTASGLVSLAVGRQGSADGRDRIRFTVTDTGAGVPADRRDQLFRPFTQADASITRRYGGTGLGLSISRRLIELMGGTIGFESQEGAGSSFWFCVDLAPAPAPAAAAIHAAPEALRPLSILLAEDLPMNQELATAVLTRAGHRVTVANDGLEAVEAARGGGFDVVLMDIQMPRMDGLAAARAIRALPAPAGCVPIYAMTANVLPDQVREFLEAGMNGHVGKPIRGDALHAALAEAAAAGTAAPPPPEVFDERTFADVRTMLPPERLATHVDALGAETAALAAGERSREEAAAAAHKIVSQAAMLGLGRLSAAARGLEEALGGGGDPEPAYAAFRAASGDVADFLRPRLADPSPP